MKQTGMLLTVLVTVLIVATVVFPSLLMVALIAGDYFYVPEAAVRIISVPAIIAVLTWPYLIGGGALALGGGLVINRKARGNR